MAGNSPLGPEETEHVLAMLLAALFKKGVLSPEEMQSFAAATNANGILQKDDVQRRAAEFIDEVAEAFIARASRET